MKTRRIVSILVWLLCLPGIFFHCLLFFVSLRLIGDPGFATSPTPDADLWISLSFPPSLLAWGVLARMNVAWISNRPVHWLWPVAGSALSMGWLIPLPITGWGVFFAIVAPGVVLALYLVVWHLWWWRKASKSDSSLNAA